jgi:hypothetical protein
MAETLREDATPGVRRTAERIKAIAREELEDTYPSDTAFVALDMPGAAQAIGRYVRAGRRVVLVYEDGTERMIQVPRKARSGVLTRILSKRRGRSRRRDRQVA